MIETRCAFGLGLVALATAIPELAWAEDSAQDTRIAIQRRAYQMAHELSLNLGTMPADPFQKGWTAGASYTVHFTQDLAWEVFNVSAAYLVSTNLKDELIDTFATSPEDFAAPRFVATTGLELTPFYGKQVFLNDLVVHQAIFLGLHGGVLFGDRGAMSATLSDLRPAAGIGLGYRVFLSKLTSLRVDVRDLLALKRAIRANESFEIDNEVHITLGISFNFWRDDA